MNRNTFLIALCGLAVAINVIAGTAVTALKIPLLFLDTIGTIFIAVMYGPGWAFLVGIITNLVLGVTSGPTEIPFGLVNGAVGLTVGYIARKWSFNLVTAIVAGVIISVVAPLIGTVIAVAVFGGLTGGAMDVFVVWLKNSGSSIFTAAFLPRITSNLIDKILSTVLVALIVQGLPTNLLKRMGYRGAAKNAA